MTSQSIETSAAPSKPSDAEPIALSSRGLVRVSGPDAQALLLGLLTNDISRATASHAIFAALLTPQGKYLFDLFVLQPEPGVFLIDTPRAADFIKRLTMYRLRSQVQIEDMAGVLKVVVACGAGTGAADTWFEDPRLQGLESKGWRWRAFVAASVAASNDPAPYEAFRLESGLPDPDRDLIVEKDFLLEGLFDELHGVDFHKGCYVGQEMTSRMKRRTSVRNKVCRVRYAGAAPEFGTAIEADGWEIGHMRSGVDHVGLALIRFDRARKALGEGHSLQAGDKLITLDPPPWLIEPVLD
jgi:tRNA-modifying protein YgfZ